MESALQSDVGSTAAGLESLEAAVSSNCEKVLLDNKTASGEKLLQLVGPVRSWLSSEPLNPFESTAVSSDVTKQATFGRLNASVLLACTCPKQTGESLSALIKCNGAVVSDVSATCCLHAPEVQLADVIFEISKAVHGVFNDQFLTFAHVYQDSLTSGNMATFCFPDIHTYVYFCFQIHWHWHYCQTLLYMNYTHIHYKLSVVN